MTELKHLQEHVDQLAATEETEPPALSRAAREFLEAGGTLNALRDSLIPKGWRFTLGRSGFEVLVMTKDAIWGEYAAALKEVQKWHSLVRKGSYDEHISADIHNLEALHARLCQFLLPTEGLGDVIDAVNAGFRGTGRLFDGDCIVDDEDDLYPSDSLEDKGVAA